MKKRAVTMALAAVLTLAMAVPSFAGSWKYVNDRWKYQRSASRYAVSEWLNLDGKTYYVGADGYMVTGWNQIDGQWYYMDENGVMQTGWLKSNGTWYFLSPQTGAMVVNTVIDGRTIDAGGAWTPTEGQTEPTDSSTDLTTPYLVQNLEGLQKQGYSIIASGRLFGGTGQWSNAIRLSGSGSYVKYNTAGQYRLLAGEFAPSTKFASDLLGRITVYGDEGKVLYSSPDIHYDEKPIPFAVDVTGQNEIKVEFSLVKDNGWDTPTLMINQLSLYQ